MLAIWNLQALGRGYAVLGTVSSRAQEAVADMQAGQAALAAQDFAGSEQRFTDAGAQLTQARQELRAALATSQAILEFVDLTGTVRSGDQLLVAGAALTEAGVHISRGLVPLQSTTVLPDQTQEVTLVEALKLALRELELANAALTDAERALSDVQPRVLPADIRADVVRLQELVPRVRRPLSAFLAQSHLLLAILGADHDREYLVVFQNNHEQRPTGGFIGSLGKVHVDQGVVEEIDVQTVYDPDGQLKEFIAPPDPLLPITDRWYLRDANWFVDFPTSARKIASFYEKEGGGSVDGVIAITPEVIRRLLTITGPIEMPAYGVTVDAENFVVLTQDLVTYSYDKEVNKPKQFLADLTPVLLNRVFSGQQEASLGVLAVMGSVIQEKHLLLYFTDADEQARVLQQGWGGALPEQAPGFLAVNNANIGGHKSDQFIHQEIDYRLGVADDGSVEAVVTIRRTHHGPTEVLDAPYPEGENPAYKDNVVWQRVLVPAGAELLEASGFVDAATVPRYVADTDLPVVPDPDVAEWQRAQQRLADGTVVGQESGYTYFANWMITRPGATSIGLYRYRLPQRIAVNAVSDIAQSLQAQVAKQPGDTRTDVRVDIQLAERFKIVHTVPHEGVTQNSDSSVVYRGPLTSDRLIGAVVTTR